MIRSSYKKTSHNAFWSSVKDGRKVTCVFFGDSWTQGYWSDDNATTSFVAQFEKALKEINSESVALNKGVGGNDTRQGLARINNDVIANSPQFCIMNFGINDWGHNDPGNRVPLSDYKTNLISMIDTLKQNNITPILWTTGPVSTTLEPYGFGGGMSEANSINKFYEYSQVLKDVAVEKELFLLDIREKIISEWKNGRDISILFYDYIHFNQDGHNILAKIFKDTLLKKT